MRLKGTNTRLKIKGGKNKLLKEKLFEFFNKNKNYYLDNFIEELTEKLKEISGTNIRSVSSIKSVEIKSELVRNTIKILEYFKKDDNDIKEFYEELYKIYLYRIKTLHLKIIKGTDNDEIKELINDKQTFKRLYEFIISKIIQAKKEGKFTITDNNIDKIRKNKQIIQNSYETFKNINDTNLEIIKDKFKEIKIDENDPRKEEEEVDEDNDNDKDKKKKRNLYKGEPSIFNSLYTSHENLEGPLFSTTSLYEKAYSSKKKPNKLKIDLELYRKQLEETKEEINKLENEIEKNKFAMVNEQKNSINYEKYKEEVSKNNFKKITTVLNMIGTSLQNLLINFAKMIAYVVTTSRNFLHTAGSMGQGIIVKLIILIIVIAIAIGVGLNVYQSVQDSDQMSFMNSDFADKFILFKKDDYNSLYYKMLTFIYAFVPRDIFNGYNVFFNSIKYIATGKNIYDKYLTPREETKEGRCDNIFHINYNNDQSTYCTLKPNDIILNYNENNYPNGDYNKLDNNLKNNINFYNYYHIPVDYNKSTGKYELQLDKSSFNNVPSRNLDDNIIKNLSKYNLFKMDNNNLILNNFNNVHHNIRSHINNDPRSYISDVSKSYSAYGICLVNPNYSGLNIAIIDVDFKDSKYGSKQLNRYISDNSNNIFYVKINKKNPNYIYITKNENDNNNPQSIFDFLNNHNKNNISILKLYNQIEGFTQYDLKYERNNTGISIRPYNDHVMPPKLGYDETAQRFYIDLFKQDDKNTFLKMDEGINGAINPIYEISVDVSKLSYDNQYSSDNYFLLYPSFDNNSLSKNSNVEVDLELPNMMVNCQRYCTDNTSGNNKDCDNKIFKYELEKLKNVETFKIKYIPGAEKSIDLELTKYIKNDGTTINPYYNDTKFLSYLTNPTHIEEAAVFYLTLLYMIINYFSRFIFCISLKSLTSKSSLYTILLISNKDDAGMCRRILDKEDGYDGPNIDSNKWSSNTIYKIDMSTYPGMRKGTEIFTKKSIQSIGCGIIDFRDTNNTNSFKTFFDKYREEIYTNITNDAKSKIDIKKNNYYEDDLYYREQKGFIGRLYSLQIDRYP